jgi:PAS domain-containing protein
VETVHEPLLMLSGDLRVIMANPAFYRLFNVTPQETEGVLLYELGNQQWNIPQLRQLLEDLLPTHTTIDNFEVTHLFAPRTPHHALERQSFPTRR